jgi:hypothetical protein
MIDAERPGSLGAETALPRRGLSDSRMLHVFVGLTYLVSFWVVYANYISVVWGYTGLLYRPMAAWELLFCVAGVSIVSHSLPTRVAHPSALILWLLFVFVYVPTMAQTFMLGERSPMAYAVALAALTAAMAGASRFSQWKLVQQPPAVFLPDRTLSFGLLIALVLATSVIVYAFREIMVFADIRSSDDVYATRFAAADRTSGILGYLRMYHTFFLSPAVMAIGLLVPRYAWFTVIGLLGLVVSYMVDASKISLIIPLAMFSAFAVTRWVASSAIFMTFGMSMLTLASSVLTNYSPLSRFIADLVLFRSIAIPGQQFALYYDLFTARGYTWWSNVRGVSLFVRPPVAFSHDLRWPALGQIVGEEYYGFGSRMNANANLFAGEGVAAGGAIGVLVIGAVLTLFLWMLDRASVGWNRAYAVVVMAPIGLALTNSHLSTLLLSCGGALWLIVFATFGPYRRVVPWQAVPAWAWKHEV